MVASIKQNGDARINLKSDLRTSKENYDFNVYDDVWVLTASLKVNFKRLALLNLDPSFEERFRLVLADYASEFSAGYVENIFYTCKALFSYGVTDRVKEHHILNYLSDLTKDKEYKLGSVRAFLMDWYDKGIMGIDLRASKLLDSLRISGMVTGRSVATGCPFSGAYSFEEQVAFINWYVDMYTEKLITLSDYAFIIALQKTGARPTQLAYLYSGDLITRTNAGVEHFDLNIPHLKKRNKNIREAFQKKENISEDLMLVLLAQANNSIRQVEAHFGTSLNADEKKIVPVFLRESEIVGLTSFQEFAQLTIKTPDFFCKRAHDCQNLVNRIAKLCPLKTQRIMIDGQAGDLHINARRFRYTHATNMAIIGASAHAIAEELGHEDIQHVTVYTEFKEEMADRIDEALAPSLVPLSQAFSGTLIDSEKDAIRVNDPRSRINTNQGESVGNCGEFGFCANGTVHCYTCNKFQPWLNAPHQQVLEKVLSERASKQKMGASEFVLQGHNRSIDAIKVVIQKCIVRKQEIEKEVAVNV